MNEKPSPQAVASQSPRGGNLPADVTSFVDRRKEISQATQLLSTARLLTLTGAGGVGKTRLALRVAAGVRRAFVDGVWLVELAALRDHTLLEQAVADTVGLRDRSTRSPLEVLVGHLRDKQLLLVLDNCEHVVDRCAGLVAELLPEAPAVRILATSRHALRTQGEYLLGVQPLPLPDQRCPPQPGKLLHNEAISLFAERATAVRPDFKVTIGNYGSIAEICHRLDGLPLAIELAAARVRILSPGQILNRLDDRFRLLSTGSPAVLPRHQTLRAVVDWSYELCSLAEQLVWARASVFAGEFDLAAAEAVCAGDGVEAPQVIDLVDGLVDKSVVVSEDHGGEMKWYRQLDTIAHFGRDVLGPVSVRMALRRRHRDYYLKLAERGKAEWFGPAQLEVAARTRHAHANLRVALEFCLGTPDESQAGLRMAGALHFYWWGCGFVTEGRHWLDRLLALDTEPTKARATALWTNAHLAILQGDARIATTTMARECQDWAQLRGEESMLAYATAMLGIAAWVGDDLAHAQTLLEDALTHFAAVGELNTTVLLVRSLLAGVAIGQGHLDRAVALTQQAYEICERHGEQLARAYALYFLSQAEWRQGELELASTHAKDSLRGLWVFSDILGTVVLVEQLAWISAPGGEYERAAVLLGIAQKLWHLVGGQPLFSSSHWITPHEACERSAHSALGDGAFQASFDRGAGLDLDVAIDYALDDAPRPAPAAPGTADDPLAPLTRRQREVAELVTQGLSNQEIAARLVIARRTAEGHVENILTKLGLTKRTQLAVWVT